MKYFCKSSNSSGKNRGFIQVKIQEKNERKREKMEFNGIYSDKISGFKRLMSKKLKNCQISSCNPKKKHKISIVREKKQSISHLEKLRRARAEWVIAVFLGKLAIFASRRGLGNWLKGLRLLRSAPQAGLCEIAV